ncbi:MAG: ribbon-helix-helix protein, CopG family [Spirulina sp. SIO3F2]|nr:ribbon-helix-helix protein, CopG family [Spirulina sp. SIO3F2]
MAKPKLKQISARLPQLLAIKLEAIATELGISRTELVRQILTTYVEHYPPQPALPPANEQTNAIAQILARLDRIEQHLQRQQAEKNVTTSTPPEPQAPMVVDAVVVERPGEDTVLVGLSFNDLCHRLGISAQQVRDVAYKHGRSPIAILSWKTRWQWDGITRRFYPP